MTKEYVKDKKAEIEQIAEHMKKISEIVATFPESASWTKSLKTSIAGFDKKIVAFLATGATLSESQKAAIAAIKSGKATESEISALSARVEKSKPEVTAPAKQQPSKKATVKKH